MPTLKNKTFYFMLFLLSSVVQSQNTDTVTVDDTASSPSEMYTSVDISYSQDKGNTDFLSLYYGLNFTLVGDLGTLKDTEFLFDFNRSDDPLHLNLMSGQTKDFHHFYSYKNPLTNQLDSKTG